MPSSLELMPQPFAWIDLPAGKVTIEAGGYLKEATTFDVPAFQIAKYPITNTQYDVFVHHADGYQNTQWWDFSDKAKAWRENRPQMNPSRFGGADFPRESVSWYDSVAFCRWLSAMTGENITIPTEQQWQRAGQGDDNRLYAWGNSYDITRFNYRIMTVIPVTQYEGMGDSPYGVVGMGGGNVREWCLTDYHGGGTDLHTSVTRVLRGSSWFHNDANECRVIHRYAYLPHVENEEWGFRIIRF